MYICKDCFLDEELRSEINANAVINGVCDVCGKEGKLMDFSDFHGFFNALLSLFSLTDNSNKTIVDIIQDEWHIFKDKDVAKILLSDIISTSHLDYSIDTCVEIMLDYPYRIAKKRIDIVKADDIAVMEPDKPQKRLIIISTIRRFYFPDYPKGSQN